MMGSARYAWNMMVLRALLLFLTAAATAAAPDHSLRFVYSRGAENPWRPHNQLCPDHRTTCSARETCCPVSTDHGTDQGTDHLREARYGCCPYSKAVCCPNKQQCCPHGYRCTQTMCMPPHQHLPPLPFVPRIADGLTDVGCPDGNQCSEDETCCLLPTGQYGCCPYPQATCCPDKLTCCPHRFQCLGQSCQAFTGSSIVILPALPKIPAVPPSQMRREVDQREP